MSDGSGFDLTKFQEGGDGEDKIKSIFGKIISGREGYETVIDKTRPVKRCECGKALMNEEKFCPECGKKCGEVLECGPANKNCEVVEKCDN
jgi:hypothetical protein